MTAAAASLRAVQVALHDHLLDRASDAAEHVRDGGRITVSQRLAIYHHAYRARLLETLHDNFERTWAYLGDATFAAAATDFIAVHAPAHRNLRWYGSQFAAWLAERFPDDVDIAELAMIDWELRCAFDGPDADPVPADALSLLPGTDWQRLGCRFAPTLRALPLRFNTVALWHALDRGESPPSAVRLEEPAWLMIWRKGWEPHFRTIGAGEHAVLTKLQSGSTVAAVVAELTDTHFGGQGAVAMVTFLRAWITEELVVGLTGIQPSDPEVAHDRAHDE